MSFKKVITLELDFRILDHLICISLNKNGVMLSYASFYEHSGLCKCARHSKTTPTLVYHTVTLKALLFDHFSLLHVSLMEIQLGITFFTVWPA